MNFFRAILATVLSTFLVGQSFANPPEERILAIPAKTDAAWSQYLANLVGVEIEVNGEKVKGYNPETRLVSTLAVMSLECHTQPILKTACAQKGSAFVRLSERNEWTETFIHEGDLRKQATVNGIWFPVVTMSETPVATVTPEQLKALEVTLTAAQDALALKIAKNRHALSSLRDELAVKETELAQLREAQKKAPTVESMTALKVEIAAAKKARDALKSSVDQQINAAIEAAGVAANNAAEPAVTQAKAAMRATNGLSRDLVKVETRANSAYYMAAIALLLAIGALIGLFLNWRRTDLVKLKAVKAAKAEATDVARAEVQKVKTTTEKVVSSLTEVRERVDNLEQAVNPKQFSFDDRQVRKQLLEEITAVKTGGIYPLPFEVDGVEYELKLVRQAGNAVTVPKGIRGHQAQNEIQISNLFRTIKAAIYDKNGPRIEPMTKGMPTLQDVVDIRKAA